MTRKKSRIFHLVDGPLVRTFLLAFTMTAIAACTALPARRSENVLLRSGKDRPPEMSTPNSARPRTCGTIRADRLEDDLTRIAMEALALYLKDPDLAALVDDFWERNYMDELIDGEVDRAIIRVKEETDLWTVLKSPWSQETARKLTSQVADHTFGSYVFSSAVERFTRESAESMTADLRLASGSAASEVFLCLQLGLPSGLSPAAIMTILGRLRKLERASPAESAMPGVDAADSVEMQDSTSRLATMVGAGIAQKLALGLAVRLSREIGIKVAQEVAQSLIPVVGWALTGLTIFNSTKGVFPAIEDGLKDPRVKEEIRNALRNALETSMDETRQKTAREIAREVIKNWKAFQAKGPAGGFDSRLFLP